MTTFDLGRLFYGKRFVDAIPVISTCDALIDLPFGERWERAVRATLWYFDGEQDTPLWFWRP